MLSVKTCFKNVTSDCMSLEECCIVFRLTFKFAEEKYAAWYLWRTFFRISMSDKFRNNSSVWFNQFSIYLMTSNIFEIQLSEHQMFNFKSLFIKFCTRGNLNIGARLRIRNCIESRLLIRKKRLTEQWRRGVHYVNSVVKQE